jgi:hypothetical protein
MLYRRIQRLLALYDSRFEEDAFVQEINKKVNTSLPRYNWLPGGFAHWRSRITRCSSGSPSAPAERQRHDSFGAPLKSASSLSK